MAGAETHWLFTTKRDGDFAIGGDPARLAEVRHAAAPHPWVWLRQVHGNVVHVVDHGNADAVRGRDGDALVTDAVGLAIAVQTADCTPVLFTSDPDPDGRRVIGAAHAGWRGLVAGVIQATVRAMEELGSAGIRAEIGPCIGVDRYEFGGPELAEVTDVFGRVVVGRTEAGTPALDTLRAAEIACLDAGLLPASIGVGSWACTARDAEAYFSHRARAETGRMAAVIWNHPR